MEFTRRPFEVPNRAETADHAAGTESFLAADGRAVVEDTIITPGGSALEQTYTPYPADHGSALHMLPEHVLRMAPAEVIDAPPRSEAEERALEKRHKFREVVGHLEDDHDIDRQRLKRIANALGTSVADDLIVLPRQDMPELKQALQYAGLRGINHPVAGFRQQDARLAIVFRTGSDGKERSPRQLRRLAIHEFIGHGSANGWVPLDPQVRRRSGPEVISPLVDGFAAAGNQGTMLEEGWARWLDSNILRFIDVNTGKIPPPYTTRSNPYNRAAIVWDVLFATDPELFDAALASRNSMQAKIEVRDRLRSIHPQLYRDLMDIKSPDDNQAIRANYLVGLNRVLDVTGTPREEVRNICDHGPGVLELAKRIVQYEQRNNYRFRSRS